MGLEQRVSYLDYPTIPNIYKEKILAQSSTRNGMSKWRDALKIWTAVWMPGLIEVHVHAWHFSTTATHFVGITATFEEELEV